MRNLLRLFMTKNLESFLLSQVFAHQQVHRRRRRRRALNVERRRR